MLKLHWQQRNSGILMGVLPLICRAFIERSTQHYRRVKGQVLCSTCLDAQAVGRPPLRERLRQRFARLMAGNLPKTS